MSAVATVLFRGGRPTNVSELRTSILGALADVRKYNPGKEIWLVSGRVSPVEGSANPTVERRRNEANLRRTRMGLQAESDTRIYVSSADIMPIVRRAISTSDYQARVDLWRGIVDSGGIDGIHVTESAPDSLGSIAEHDTGVRRRLHIEYATPATRESMLNAQATRRI